MNILVAMADNSIRSTFIPPEVEKKIELLGNVSWNTTSNALSAEELKLRIKDSDVCITGWGCKCFDRNVLEGNQSLRLIAHTGGSVARIVSDYLYEKGIRVISGNKLYSESVAEGVIAYMLASLRDISFYSNEMQSGDWQKNADYNEGLLEQNIGLVGFGAVARSLVKMLKVFRVKVKVYDPYVTEQTCIEYGVTHAESIEEIFTTSKLISMHAPEVPETYHMIDKELIAKIPDGTVFINTARGGIVDENALSEELQKGRFKAVLDVYEVEPLPEDSKLRGLKNVILMPHMAGPTVDRRKNVMLEILEDIERFFDGQQLQNEISKEYAMMMTR